MCNNVLLARVINLRRHLQEVLDPFAPKNNALLAQYDAFNFKII